MPAAELTEIARADLKEMNGDLVAGIMLGALTVWYLIGALDKLKRIRSALGVEDG